MSVTTTTIAYLLKQVYRDINETVFKDRPLLAMLTKQGGFTGSAMLHALRHRDTLARSPTFSTAQTNAATSLGATKGCQFTVPRVKNYQLYILETEAILASRDDKGSFLRGLTTEVDSALNNVANDVAKDLYGAGMGVRASGVTISSTTITVGESVSNFEVGMVIVTAASATGALRNSGTGQTITVVDRSAGTIVVDANTDTITNGDFLFEKGDRGTGASPTPLKIAGMDAWCPASVASSGDSFMGVDRYAQGDIARVAGLTIDVSSYNPEEGLVTALALSSREGTNPPVMLTSFADVKNIQLALGSKAVTEYMDVGGIGFSTIRVTGPKGDVRVMADQFAPPGIWRFITPSTWSLRHAGDLFNVLDLDGAPLSRVYNSDAWEGRVGFYGNLFCDDPHKNLRAIAPTS